MRCFLIPWSEPSPYCKSPSLPLAVVLSDKVSPYRGSPDLVFSLTAPTRGSPFCKGGSWALGDEKGRMGSSAHSAPRLAGSEPLPEALLMKCALDLHSVCPQHAQCPVGVMTHRGTVCVWLWEWRSACQVPVFVCTRVPVLINPKEKKVTRPATNRPTGG